MERLYGVISIIFIISIYVILGFSFCGFLKEDKDNIQKEQCLINYCKSRCKEFSREFGRILNINTKEKDGWIDCKCMDEKGQLGPHHSFSFLLKNTKCGS